MNQLSVIFDCPRSFKSKAMYSDDFFRGYSEYI